jgi:hypothetical protein
VKTRTPARLDLHNCNVAIAPRSGGTMARPRLSLLLLLLLCTAGVVTASQEVEDEVADAVEDATPEESPQAAFAHLVFRKVCVCVVAPCCCWKCAPRCAPLCNGADWVALCTPCNVPPCPHQSVSESEPVVGSDVTVKLEVFNPSSR